MIRFFGYKKCGTSRKAESFLEAKGIDYTFIDITENPPSSSELKKVSKMSGIAAKKMFNTSGQAYREGNFKEKIPGMSDDEIFQILAANGRLIKRPVVLSAKNASVGFSEESLEKF